MPPVRRGHPAAAYPVRQLNEVTDGGCGYIGEYKDLSGPDARVMLINYNAEGLDRITVAAV